MKPLRGGESGIAVLRAMIDGGDDDALEQCHLRLMASYLKAVGPGDSDEHRTDHRAPE